MKVILLDYVYKHGVAGEVINVADGFARNYLIPKGLAVQASEGELKRAAKLREQAAVKRAMLENRMNELARIIDGVQLAFGRRAASTGKLFGSVTTQEIADALREKTGADINRRRISGQGLRELGIHDVVIRLGNEIAPTIKVTVVRDDELADFLTSMESGKSAEEILETGITEIITDDTYLPLELDPEVAAQKAAEREAARAAEQAARLAKAAEREAARAARAEAQAAAEATAMLEAEAVAEVEERVEAEAVEEESASAEDRETE